METEIIKRAKNVTKHWYLSLILGILFICVGIWVLRTPLESYLTLSILFSVTIFISGISEIIFSVTNRKEMDNWGWVLAGGIIDLLLGIWLISSPLLSIAVLPFIVGFMLMFRSMIAMGFAFDVKGFADSGWGWLLALGILGLLFSFVLLWNPLFAGLTIVILTGCGFITIGIFRIILSLNLNTCIIYQRKHPYFNRVEWTWISGRGDWHLFNFRALPRNKFIKFRDKALSFSQVICALTLIFSPVVAMIS